MPSRPAVDIAAFAMTSGVLAASLATPAGAQSAGEIIAHVSNGLMREVAEHFGHAPALVLGLGIIGAIPVVSVIGAVLSSRLKAREQANKTEQNHRKSLKNGRPGDTPQRGETHPAWPVRAWIEIEAAPGLPGLRQEICQPVLRLGRDVENDVCVRNETVSRFHAAFFRTEDAEYYIRDFSGPAGAGVRLNGTRRQECRLQNNDAIELGTQRIVFRAESSEFVGTSLDAFEKKAHRETHYE